MTRSFRIPTPVALLTIAVLIGAMVVGNRYFSTTTQADVTTEPQDIQISNLTDTSLTVTWMTEKPTRSAIVLKTKSITNPKTLPFFDDRSTTGSDLYTSHIVTARGLTPSTSYEISIVAASRSQAPQKIEASTFPTVAIVSNQLGPSYGSVEITPGKPADGALVFLNLPNSQLLSSYVKPSGSFLIPLNLIRTTTGDSFLPIDSDRLQISLKVKYGIETAQVTTDTINDSPIPTFNLGETVDFRNSDQSKETINNQPTPLAQLKTTALSTVLGQQVAQASPPATTYLVTLTEPEKGAAIASEYPNVAGSGVPDKIVSITLGNKNPELGTAKVGKDGIWNYTPKKPVGIGNQSVTITSLDQNQKPVTLTHLFQILKSGTQVLGDATPSGSIVPTVRVAVSPSPTMVALSPTAIASPTAELPVTSTVTPTYLVLAAGIAFMFFGLIALAR